MTDDELIAFFAGRTDATASNEYKRKVDRLIALARIGAAVKPIPIAAAPSRDAYHKLWFWWPATQQWERGALIEQAPGKLVWYRHGRPADDEHSPTYFLHNSAIPQPGPKP